ncbi:MAG TPA: hypothetical protein VNI52_05460 [Sphingobacteriaceae bacterium]|nr:hypothetical protein [Sphingobacteriaceae bacterium]
MKKLILPVALFAITLLSGCEVIGDIFQVGFYAGIFIVIAIVLLIVFLFRKFRGS